MAIERFHPELVDNPGPQPLDPPDDVLVRYARNNEYDLHQDAERDEAAEQDVPPPERPAPDHAKVEVKTNPEPRDDTKDKEAGAQDVREAANKLPAADKHEAAATHAAQVATRAAATVEDRREMAIEQPRDYVPGVVASPAAQSAKAEIVDPASTPTAAGTSKDSSAAGAEVQATDGQQVIDDVPKDKTGNHCQEDGEDYGNNPNGDNAKRDGLEGTHQKEETRREYMRGRGFVVVNDTGHEVMEEARDLPVKPLPTRNWHPPEEAVPSSVSLGMVTNDLVSKIQPIITPNETFKEKHGISPEDITNNQFLAEEGFADLDFTWYFSAGVATAIIEAGVEQGYITGEQQAAMTLGDWSDMIGSDWFSDTMHDMALTRGGIYVNFGKGMSWYTSPGGFRQVIDVSEVSLEPADTDLFVFQPRYDATTSTTSLTARISSPFKKELRRLMKAAESPGCPVARHAGTVPKEVTQGNLHVQRQINRSILTLDPARNGKVHFAQVQTPIDRGLHALARLLDTYDKQFGTPLWTGDNGSLEHHQVPRTNVLRRNGKIPFVRAHELA